MTVGQYAAGVAFLAGTWGAAAASAVIARRRWWSHLTGAPATVGALLLFSVFLLGAHLLPGMATVLTRGSVLATSLLLFGAVLALASCGPRIPSPAPDAAAGPRRPQADAMRGARSWLDGHTTSQLLAWGLAGAAVVMVAGCLLLFLRIALPDAIVHVDTTSFHLPGVARWIQSGSIWHNDEFLPMFPTGTYPENGDVLFLAAVLPWHNDAFVRLVDIPYLLLAVLAVYALARELGAGPAASVLLGVAAIAVRAVLRFSVDALDPDAFLLATYAAGALFLARHLRTRAGSDLVLAGLALGLALGAKWYGPSSVIALLVAWALVSALAGERAGAVIRRALPLIGLIAVAGGVWFVRNLVATGDPLYPVNVKPFGLAIFTAPPDLYRQLYGYSVLDRLGQGASWSGYILPELRSALGVGGILLALAALVSLRSVLPALRRRRLAEPRVAMLALGAILVAAAYAITPNSAQGWSAHPFPGLVGGNARYVTPALVLAAPLCALAAERLSRGQLVVLAVAFVAVLDGLAQTFSFSLRQLLPYVLLCAAVAAALVAAELWRRSAPARPARVALAAGIATLVGLAAIAGGVEQRRFNRHRYVAMDPNLDWLARHAPAGHRVAVSGTWTVSGSPEAPVWPLFGPRIGNYVAYVGPLVGGTLHRYASAQAFDAALTRGGFDLLLVGRGVPPEASVPEVAWAQQAGFQQVAASPRFVLLRDPPLYQARLVSSRTTS